MGMIRLDEYTVAVVAFIAAAFVLFLRAVHWEGITGWPRITKALRLVLALGAFALFVVLTAGTRTIKGEKPWSGVGSRWWPTIPPPPSVARLPKPPPSEPSKPVRPRDKPQQKAPSQTVLPSSVTTIDPEIMKLRSEATDAIYELYRDVESYYSSMNRTRLLSNVNMQRMARLTAGRVLTRRVFDVPFVRIRDSLMTHIRNLPPPQSQARSELYTLHPLPDGQIMVQDVELLISDLRLLLNEMEIENGLAPSCRDLTLNYNLP